MRVGEVADTGVANGLQRGLFAPPRSPLRGSLTAERQRPSGGASGGFYIDFTQSGNQLTGAISIAGTPCITTGVITGTLSGNSISFGAVKGSQTIE